MTLKFKIRKAFANLINQIAFARLRRTTKSRQVLRDQKVRYQGKTWLVMDYIDFAAQRIPPMFDPLGNAIDHVHRARQWYYKYDFRGVRYYFKSLRRSIRYMKVQSEVRKEVAHV